MAYKHIQIPEDGERITIQNGVLQVPDQPIIGFIEGDGTGPDIWRAARPVLDAAVEKAYGGKRKIAWAEIYAGEKANQVYGEPVWLPEETLDFIREYLVAMVGRLMAEEVVHGKARSLDITPFRLHRFREGRFLKEKGIV